MLSSSQCTRTCLQNTIHNTKHNEIQDHYSARHIKKIYSTNTKKTIHGTGQGSGASGSNWLFTSVPMMDTIEQNCEGCTIHSPDKKLTWTKHILGLVDDARQYANDWNNNNIVYILNYLQQSSQTWEHLLHTTGGGT